MSTANLSGASGNKVLEKKIALVTGASRGIGMAVCHNLASKGCSLIMGYTSDSSRSKAESLATDLQSTHGIKAIAVQADMGSESGPAQLIAAAKDSFTNPETGKFQLDILINNAGVAKNMSIEECNAVDFALQYNVNVRGPLLLVKEALPYLPNDRSGRIVNLSSVSSTLGFVGQSIYGGTKAALEAMTRTWARELAERCTVNAVNPGPVATDMYGGTDPVFQERLSAFLKHTPLATPREGIDRQQYVDEYGKTGGRPAYEHEIAGIIGLLCSPEAGWSTGSVVCANGGMIFSA